MIKHPKTYIVSVLLAIVVAVGLIVFDQLTSSQPLPPLVLEEAAYVQGKSDIQGEPHSLDNSTAHLPLQAQNVEEVKLNVNHRLRPAYDLFSTVLQLFALENKSYQPKALFFYAKPLCLSEPIYILFRKILV